MQLLRTNRQEPGHYTCMRPELSLNLRLPEADAETEDVRYVVYADYQQDDACNPAYYAGVV